MSIIQDLHPQVLTFNFKPTPEISSYSFQVNSDFKVFYLLSVLASKLVNNKKIDRHVIINEMSALKNTKIVRRSGCVGKSVVLPSSGSKWRYYRATGWKKGPSWKHQDEAKKEAHSLIHSHTETYTHTYNHQPAKDNIDPKWNKKNAFSNKT